MNHTAQENNPPSEQTAQLVANNGACHWEQPQGLLKLPYHVWSIQPGIC